MKAFFSIYDGILKITTFTFKLSVQDPDLKG